MSAPEPGWIAAVRERLRGNAIGCEVRHVRRAPSTNDLARAWLDEGGPHGLVVIADAQTSGRGRRGRSWSSEPGMGLYLTVGLRPALDGARAAWLTLVGAVASAEALRAAGVEAVIRWPNDVDARGRKIGGVLCESRVEGMTLSSAVLGIGLNLGQQPADFPPGFAGRATSARIETGETPSRRQVAGDVLERLGDRYAMLDAAPEASPLLRRFRELSPDSAGSPVIVDREGESFRGTTRGIEPDGGLRVERPDGRISVIRVGELRRLRIAGD